MLMLWNANGYFKMMLFAARTNTFTHSSIHPSIRAFVHCRCLCVRAGITFFSVVPFVCWNSFCAQMRDCICADYNRFQSFNQTCGIQNSHTLRICCSCAKPTIQFTFIFIRCICYAICCSIHDILGVRMCACV